MSYFWQQVQLEAKERLGLTHKIFLITSAFYSQKISRTLQDILSSITSNTGLRSIVEMNKTGIKLSEQIPTFWFLPKKAPKSTMFMSASLTTAHLHFEVRSFLKYALL